MSVFHTPHNRSDVIPPILNKSIRKRKTSHSAKIKHFPLWSYIDRGHSVSTKMAYLSAWRWRDFRDQKYIDGEESNLLDYDGEDEWLQSELQMFRCMNDFGKDGVKTYKLLSH